MKILHITNAVGWSGGMEQMFLLIGELQKKNHQNILVCPPQSELAQKLSSLGIRTEIIKMYQDYDLIAAWKMRKLVLESSPDIVHAHHPMAHAIALVALTGLKEPPLVVSRRVSFSLRKNPFSLWKYKSGRISRYVVVSNSVKEILVKGGVDPSKIEVVYSGVSPGRFLSGAKDGRLREKLGIPSDCAVVGKVANFSFWKGQHVFLDAAKICVGKNAKIIFVLAGKGTETLGPAVQERGISGNVRLLGFRKDIPEVLSLFTVSVNSAIEGEGLSGVIRESLMMGIPVVASGVAGNREIVRQGETGFIVPAGNADLLAERIFHVLEHLQESRKMAEKGREWVLKNATVEVMAARMINLYSSLLNRTQ